jgi:hypothetical protein
LTVGFCGHCGNVFGVVQASLKLNIGSADRREVQSARPNAAAASLKKSLA